MATKLFNLLAVSSAALLLASLTSPATALSIESHGQSLARHAFSHDLVAKKRRSLGKRCNAQHPSFVSKSATKSSSTATSTKASSTKKVAVATTTKQTTTAAATATANPDSTTKKVGLAWANGADPSLKYYKTDKTQYLYSWSPEAPSNAKSLGFTFVPMLWGYNQVDSFKSLVVEGYSTHCLGMNEPNQSGQSNMSPQDGITLWNEYIAPLRAKGYSLGSPATSSAPSGKQWMIDFFAGLDEGTDAVDFVCIHWYDISADAFIAYVEDFYNTFKKPIWVTEFADQNFNSGPQSTMSEVWTFMETVTAWMDKTDYVHAYFAFGIMHDMQGVNDDNQLMSPSGLPTDLGYYYINA